MFSHTQYVPVLKWKLGEYQALDRLHEATKSEITPLIEIPPIGWDHEKRVAAKTLDEHVSGFGKKLATKWGRRECFIDTRWLTDRTVESGAHVLAELMADARESDCLAIPICSIDAAESEISAVRAVNESDRRGVALRLGLGSLQPGIERAIGAWTAQAGVRYNDVDILIDVDCAERNPATEVDALMAGLGRLPALNRWRTFTILGSAWPEDFGKVDGPVQVERTDWTMYRMFVERAGAQMRLPSYGDYGPNSILPLSVDMRVIKPLAKLRYTTPEFWYLARGTQVKGKDGFGQYQQMCRDLTGQPWFDGRDFSAGDRYIADCADGEAKTGNLTTWAWVAANRHISRASADLANLYGS